VKEHLSRPPEELSLLDGLAGHEQPVIRYLRDHLLPFADEVQVGVNGIPSIALGMALRCSHSPSSVCHLDDMEACLQLSEAMVRHGIERSDLNFLQEDQGVLS